MWSNELIILGRDDAVKILRKRSGQNLEFYLLFWGSTRGSIEFERKGLNFETEGGGAGLILWLFVVIKGKFNFVLIEFNGYIFFPR